MKKRDGHLQTHLADNQIKVAARYITDKLFIKHKSRVASGGPGEVRWRPSELKGSGGKIRAKGPCHVRGPEFALSK